MLLPTTHPIAKNSVTVRGTSTHRTTRRSVEGAALSEMNEPPLACQGALSSDTQQLLVDAALSPSIPATPDVDAGAPCPKTAVPHGLAEPPINDISSLLDASAPFPLPSAAPQPLQTPIHEEDRPHLDLSLGLPSTNFSLPTPTLVRTAHNLRLPSFDVLGIAAPHPDRFPLQTSHSFSLGAGPLSKPEDPLHALSPPLDLHRQADGANNTPATSPKATRSQVERLIPTFTPPSEPGTFNWGSFVNVKTAGVGSPPSSDPGVSPNLHITSSATAPGQAPIIVPTHAELSDVVRMAAWVEETKNIISKGLYSSYYHVAK